jgi:hypothetical protein
MSYLAQIKKSAGTLADSGSSSDRAAVTQRKSVLKKRRQAIK